MNAAELNLPNLILSMPRNSAHYAELYRIARLLEAQREGYADAVRHVVDRIRPSAVDQSPLVIVLLHLVLGHIADKPAEQLNLYTQAYLISQELPATESAMVLLSLVAMALADVQARLIDSTTATTTLQQAHAQLSASGVNTQPVTLALRNVRLLQSTIETQQTS